MPAPIVRQNAQTAPAVQAYNAWRPPQWAKPAMVSITVPAGYATATSQSASLPSFTFSGGQTLIVVPQTYVFDAVLSLEHEQTVTKTMHPVQSGSAISSHAYINPAKLALYVLMSDASAAYVSSSQATPPYIQAWQGYSSKSVSAYQQVLTLQAARYPLVVTTRLRTYSNMIIAAVSPYEDSKSIAGARFRLELEQIFVANIQNVPVSARPNDTDSTGVGATQVQPPSSTTTTQFGVPATATSVNVPGAGGYSSDPQQDYDGTEE